MYSLIFSLLSIVLFSLVLLSGINYINIDKYNSKILETQVVNDMYSYQLSINSFYNFYNFYPNNAEWENQLKNLNLDIPSNKNFEYSYYKDPILNKISVCYSLLASKKEIETVEKIFQKGGFIRNSVCFSENNSVVDDGLNYPTTITLTKWIKK